MIGELLWYFVNYFYFRLRLEFGWKRKSFIGNKEGKKRFRNSSNVIYRRISKVIYRRISLLKLFY